MRSTVLQNVIVPVLISLPCRNHKGVCARDLLYSADVTPFLVTHCDSEAKTLALGAQIGAHLQAGDLVRLSAPLGMGKTVLARGIILSLMDEEVAVTSPTFNLIQPYTGRLLVWHADLYRLNHPEEVLELGLDDALDQGAVLVEWPEQAEGMLPPGGLVVTGQDLGGQGRSWTLAGDEVWRKRMIKDLDDDCT